jgi:outer membrane protein W
VPAPYADFITLDGAEIERDLRLRMIPITATGRFLLRDRDNGIQPYVGAGVGAVVWRYSEIGPFVDTTNLEISRGRPVKNGTSVGPVLLGGVLFRVGRGRGLGGEIRYQRAAGDLGPDFPADRIDLGGLTYHVVFRLRF